MSKNENISYFKLFIRVSAKVLNNAPDAIDKITVIPIQGSTWPQNFYQTNIKGEKSERSMAFSRDPLPSQAQIVLRLSDAMLKCLS